MRRMLDVLLPKVEVQLKSWSTCIDDAGSAVPGERLTEVTIMLRTKFRNYIQAVLEKLVENVSSANETYRTAPYKFLCDYISRWISLYRIRMYTEK